MPGNTTPTTPAQAFPVPVNGDDPDVPLDMFNLAKAIEKRVMGIYASAAERNTFTTAAGVVEGMFAYLRDTNTVTYYDGTAWVNFPPTVPAITNSTSVPSNSVGVDGDVHFKV
jgi:hypothetical protein